MVNNVTSPSFWAAAGIRALRTFVQALIALAGLNLADLFSARWQAIVLSALVTTVLSILTSIGVGIPEAPNDTPNGPVNIRS